MTEATRQKHMQMQQQEEMIPRRQTSAIELQQGFLIFTRHWLALVNLASAAVAGVPWLAPVLMKVGATWPARVIYFLYAFLCHQLANRSFFLFGPKPMYSHTELLPFAPNANTWSGLRDFVGTPELGYKVAWSDRMVSISIGILLGGVIFALVRRSLHSLDWRIFGLTVLSMAVDGASHFVSDLAGVGRGFRHTNAWLASLSGNRMPPSFYLGNGFGSFNSWMRIITGFFLGLAVVWLVYPRLQRSFQNVNEPLGSSRRQSTHLLSQPKSTMVNETAGRSDRTTITPVR